MKRNSSSLKYSNNARKRGKTTTRNKIAALNLTPLRQHRIGTKEAPRYCAGPGKKPTFQSLTQILTEIVRVRSQRVRSQLTTLLVSKVSAQEKAHFDNTFDPIKAQLPDGTTKEAYTQMLSQVKINKLPNRAQYWAAGDKFGETRLEYVDALHQIQEAVEEITRSPDAPTAHEPNDNGLSKSLRF